MESLAVLYDDGCPFCRRCATWLAGKRAAVALRLLSLRSMEARDICGGSIPAGGRELVVVGSSGDFWVGPAAFIMCLWALPGYRWLAALCAEPGLARHAVLFFELLSGRRQLLSRLLGRNRDRCADGHCGVGSSAYR